MKIVEDFKGNIPVTSIRKFKQPRKQGDLLSEKVELQRPEETFHPQMH